MAAVKHLDSKKIRRWIDRGWDISRIAKRLGATYNGVRLHVVKENMPYVFDIARKSRIDMPDLQLLLDQGWTTSQIGKKYRCDSRVVWAKIKKQKLRYKPDQSGSKNPAWNGGRRPSGPYFYIYVPDHPYATTFGCVLEHRLVMEKKLGRYLLPNEVVHHKKGYKNNPGNLELYNSNAEHLADTLKGKCPKWTPDGRRRILEAIRKPRGPRKKPSRAKSKKSVSS